VHRSEDEDGDDPHPDRSDQPSDDGAGSNVRATSPPTRRRGVARRVDESAPDGGAEQAGEHDAEEGKNEGLPRRTKRGLETRLGHRGILSCPPVRTLVVLPTYNEADNIVDVIVRVRRAMPSADVLVADDNSPDGTADLAEQAGREAGGVHVLRRARKEGLGPAYKAGFAWAIDHGYDVVVQMDADLQFNPADVPHLVARVEAGADYAIGARYIAGGAIPEEWPWHRRALSKWANRYARFMLRLSGHDATSGFRAVRADLLKRIEYETVRADGYGFLIEMLYRFQRAGAVNAEIPIVFRDREYGKSKMSGRIVVEAWFLVTRWGIRDRLRRGRRPPG